MSWNEMDSVTRISLRTLSRDDIPTSPGVYALYRNQERIYVGKAKSLRQRAWGNHSGRGVSMTGSALRRNVAAHLQIATASQVKTREYTPSLGDARAVRDWLDDCEIAWLECSSEADAIELERSMKREFIPPLTKQ